MTTVLGCGSGNQSIVKFEVHLKMVTWWLWRPTITTKALVQFAKRLNLFSLIAMKLACRNNGGGGSRVSWLLQNGVSWGRGNSGAGMCWQTDEDGLWFFPNACVWICWRWGTSMGAEWATMRTFCWEQMGEGEVETVSLILYGGKGRGTDRKPNFVACSARIVSGWMLVVWGTGFFSELAENTNFVYLVLRTLALGMGQTVRLGKRNTLCCKSGIEIYF